MKLLVFSWADLLIFPLIKQSLFNPSTLTMSFRIPNSRENKFKIKQ